jgi:pyruvate ferredoxin oxidoreductase alpha subunit
MKQINPDVVAAYPITPQTETVMKFSQYVADGEVDTEMVTVESEHSAMSACVGAAATGARAVTATSANGLALMWEIVYIASSARLPIIMEVVNRALSAPINIHCDHSDSMGCRDASWIQIYSENNQEVYENTIMAVRIAEHKDVQLPIMICQDGFITSHSLEDVAVFSDEVVQKFIGQKRPVYSVLDINKPITWGPLDLQDYYFEHKRQQAEAMKNSFKVIDEIHKEFEKLSGVKYDFIEEYETKDAEVVIIAMNSVCGTTKYVIDKLRKDGKKVGLVKVRIFRPFHHKKIADALSKFKAIAVLDRSESFGSYPPLYNEILASMYLKNEKPPLIPYVYGLGGRDTTVKNIESVYEKLFDIVKGEPYDDRINYLGVR